MHLIELFLPAGQTFAVKRSSLARELADRFGGVTAFNRSPAKGLFSQQGRQVEDDMIVFEVLAEALERDWWSALRGRLENDFEQDEILIRASSVERL